MWRGAVGNLEPLVVSGREEILVRSCEVFLL